MSELNKKDPVKMSPITMFFGLGVWVGAVHWINFWVSEVFLWGQC